jgi:hypothetical protein
MKMKIGIVLVVLIALVGVYFFAPNMLGIAGSGEVMLTPKYVNVPAYTPEDLTIQIFVDGNQVDASGFTVKCGSTHSFTIRAILPTGAVYGERTMMLTMPSESGNYDVVMDASIGTVQLVKT